MHKDNFPLFQVRFIGVCVAMRIDCSSITGLRGDHKEILDNLW